jgi:tRNA splicing endonuclease
MSSLKIVAKARQYAESSVAQEKKQLQKAIAKLKYSIENRNFFAEKLESYKRAKLENLSSEDLAYLNERGVSVEEFKSWTTLEQETFLKCR